MSCPDKKFCFDPLLVFLSVAYFTVCSSTIASSGDDNTLHSVHLKSNSRMYQMILNRNEN